MHIIDTHLHLVYPQKFSYPWLVDAPSLNRGWSVEAYFAEASALGITGAIHMEVDVAPRDIHDETRFALTLPGIVGAIAGCRPESEGFLGEIEKLISLSGVKGVRRVLHQVPDAVSQTALFVANIRQLQAFDLCFDLCVRADQLPLAIALARQAPDIQFILDHCGVPKVAEGQTEPWRADITELARLPNVAAKISGIAAYAGADWTVDSLRPYIEHIIESFGWDRVVWGSDHPVVTLTGTLTRWVEATQEIVAGTSESERAKLWHGNAQRIYGV